MKRPAIFVAGAVAGGLLVFLALSWKGAGPEFEPKAMKNQASTASLLRSLGKMQTATSVTEQLVELTDGQTVVVRGKTTAGFDFSGLLDQAVQISPNGQLTVDLPAPQIFATEVDGQKTKSYDPKAKAFNIQDVVMSEALKSVAQQSTRAGACADEIFVRAAENMEATVQALFKGIGYNQVSTRTQMGKCE